MIGKVAALRMLSIRPGPPKSHPDIVKSVCVNRIAHKVRAGRMVSSRWNTVIFSLYASYLNPLDTSHAFLCHLHGMTSSNHRCLYVHLVISMLLTADESPSCNRTCTASVCVALLHLGDSCRRCMLHTSSLWPAIAQGWTDLPGVSCRTAPQGGEKLLAFMLAFMLAFPMDFSQVRRNYL